MTTDTFQSKLDHLSDQPGVYLFKNQQGDIL
jgi:excinuclease UvrABC nuclease subunit